MTMNMQRSEFETSSGKIYTLRGISQPKVVKMNLGNVVYFCKLLILAPLVYKGMGNRPNGV